MIFRKPKVPVPDNNTIDLTLIQLYKVERELAKKLMLYSGSSRAEFTEDSLDSVSYTIKYLESLKKK